MRSDSTSSYSEVSSRICTKIREATQTLEQLGYVAVNISEKEFYDYMTGETPTGDKTTLDDVLNGEFLMVHEVVEISELKKMNVPINQKTVTCFYPKVYEAHLTAMNLELTFTLNKRDYKWLKHRFVSSKDFMSQLDDPFLGPEFGYLRKKLSPKSRAIARKFSKHVAKV